MGARQLCYYSTGCYDPLPPLFGFVLFFFVIVYYYLHYSFAFTITIIIIIKGRKKIDSHHSSRGGVGGRGASVAIISFLLNR